MSWTSGFGRCHENDTLRMSKILILTAAFGEGHNTAARNLQAAFVKEGKGEVSAEVHDLYETVYPRITSGLQKGYKFAIHKAPRVWRKIYDVLDTPHAVERTLFTIRGMGKVLQKMVRDSKAAAIVSTYPVYNYLLDRVYKGTEKPFKQYTMITDAITINSAWYRCNQHPFFVTDELTSSILHDAGVPKELIRVTGFPVSDKFDDTSQGERRPAITKDSPARVLYLIHSESVESMLAARKLLAMEDIELTLWVGKNAGLRKRIAGLIGESGRPASILGWTQKMPEMMLKHHLLIGKAGGATVQEAIAARCPMLVSQVVPGQEEGNLRLILESDIGGLAVTGNGIVQAVEDTFANGAAIWRRWHANIEKVRKAEAARGIARYVLGAIRGEQSS